ncbi:MAG TPA: glycosyltransferase [Thermoleophilaceae bacterium]
MSAPRATVVVATRDRVGRLRALLESLRGQTAGDFEVVVVDDGSVGGGVRELLGREQGGLDVRAVLRPGAGGPSAARNDGWPLARAPLVAFVDDDCVATPGWLAALLAAADSEPGAIVQGRTLPDPREARRLGPYSRSLWVEAQGPYYQACNILYPRELLERLGGFDAEAFPHVGEDTDLAWRAIAAGARIAFAPDALVHHAVVRLGPAGKLRLATRWTPSIRLFARHRALRAEHLTYGIFWKGSHYLLVRALLGLALARRARPLALWLAAPYVRHLLERGRVEGGGPLHAPYHAVYDLVELAAVLRGAIRYRTLVV